MLTQIFALQKLLLCWERWWPLKKSTTKQQIHSDEKSAISIHLRNFYKEIDGLTFFSGFCGALKDARKMTGRNPLTGEKDKTNKFGHLGSWLGTIGYLLLLDQIGNCFKHKDKSKIKDKKSGIIKALKYFSDLSDDEINVIYALRNAFAHDYSLINVGKPELTFHFEVFHSPTKPLVIFGNKKWDGQLSTMTNDNKTKVNLEAIADITENIYKTLLRLADENKLEIMLPNGFIELSKRYTFVTGKKII